MINSSSQKQDKIYECVDCKVTFNTYKSYYNHTHRKTSCVPIVQQHYECDICKTVFATSNGLWKHVNRKTSCLTHDICKDIVEENKLATGLPWQHWSQPPRDYSQFSGSTLPLAFSSMVF